VKAAITGAILIGVVAAMPSAHATDAASLSCIEQRMGPAAIELIVENVTKKLIAGSPEAPAFDETAFNAAAEECARRYHWSADARMIASEYANARIARPSLEAALRAAGVDPAAVAAALASLTVEQRHSLLKGPDDATVQQLLAAFAARQVPKTEKVIGSAGALADALAAIEFYPAEFAAA
jgi:hypothetical protein